MTKNPGENFRKKSPASVSGGAGEGRGIRSEADGSRRGGERKAASEETAGDIEFERYI